MQDRMENRNSRISFLEDGVSQDLQLSFEELHSNLHCLVFAMALGKDTMSQWDER